MRIARKKERQAAAQAADALQADAPAQSEAEEPVGAAQPSEPETAAPSSVPDTKEADC